MEIVSFTIHNDFAKMYNLPQEDSCKHFVNHDLAIFAVADGITRDPIRVQWLPKKSEEAALKTALSKYPRPSPAKIAADLFCSSFIEYLKNNNSKNDRVKKAFEFANNIIKVLNKDRKVNYLDNDFAACVASGAIIENGFLEWGFITDCGMAVFNSSGELKFQTLNEAPSPEIDRLAKSQNKTWRDPEWRARVRSHYRNNPQEQMAYGALTGQKEALDYIRTGKIKIEKGEYLAIYSDGAFSIITDKSFNIAKDFHNLLSLFESKKENLGGSEATIIAVKI